MSMGILDSTAGTPKEAQSAVEHKTGGLLSSLHPQRSATTVEKTTGYKKSSIFSFTNTQKKQDLSPHIPSQTGAVSAANTVTSRQGLTSVPATPVRDQQSYSRLSTVSPSFQTMQPDPPSAESTPSSSSTNTPPRSPLDIENGAIMETPKTSAQQHQISSKSASDEYPPAPQTPSQRISKRRKSFGILMASGGANSHYDAIPDERMEILRTQIVDKVRGVVLGQEADVTDGERRGDMAKGAAPRLPDSEHNQPSQRRASSSNPFHDIWLRTASTAKDGHIRSSLDHGDERSKQVSVRKSTANSSKLTPHFSNVDSNLASRLAAATAALNTTTTSSNTAAIGQTMNGSADSGDFQVKILENVIQDCLNDFRQEIRRDIQNMHLELLRQFQIQKMDIEALVREHSDTSDLWRMIEQLQEENRQLRSRTTRL
ncbi:Protein nedd1 [Actinomortierella wolfii]|nr:Protein nedd1 [Actinomortierella wolfii]